MRDYEAIARILGKSDDIPMDLANLFTQEDHSDRHGSECSCTDTWPNKFDRDRFFRYCYGDET